MTGVKIYRLAAAVLAVWCCASAAMAGDDLDTLLGRAQRLLENAHPQQAADLLNGRLNELSGNPRYDLILADALRAAGHSSDAGFAYERVLMVEPGNVPARLALARIAAENGDITLARETLAPLNTYAPSESQRKDAAAIGQLIAERSASQAIEWQSYAQGGFGWDSNASVGPDATSLLLPGVSSTPVSLGNGAADGDTVQFLEVGASMRFTMGERTWLLGGANLRRGHYDTRTSLREGYINAFLGAAHQWRENLLSATALGQDYRVGDDLYRSMWAVRLGWLRAEDDNARLSAYYQYSDLHYPNLTAEDAVRHELGITRIVQKAAGITLQYGARVGLEATKYSVSTQLGYHLLGVNAGVEKQLSDKLSASLGAVFEARNYGAVDPLYYQTRHDQQWSVGAAADYRLTPQFHLIPQITYVRNRANLELFDYTRSTYMLIFRWEFANDQ